MSIQAGKGGSDDSPKIQECFFIDLIPDEQFGVVAEITEKPGKFPEGAFRAVQPAVEKKCLKRNRLQDAEL